jgi:hypothetical protein
MPMNRRTPVQRLSALVLLAALPTLSGTIPILDVMVGDGKAAVETHHHPGTHGFPHNHLLCIQHQASQWVMAWEIPLPLNLATVHLPASPNSISLIRLGQISLPRARAPPFA